MSTFSPFALPPPPQKEYVLNQEPLQRKLPEAGRRTFSPFGPPPQEEYVLNQEPLQRKLSEAGRRYGVRSVAPECAHYLSLVVEAHLAGLLQAMAKAATQRTDPAK